MLRRSLLCGVGATALCAMAPRRVALLGSNGPSLDLNFLAVTALDSRITFTRASTATSGLYTDATGSSYTSYSTNVARIDTVNGLLIEEQRTNSLLNSDAPVTQTTASLGTGTYTLWVIGTGSATSSAGTAVGSGFGAATAGTPNSFTLTGAGTVTVTVGGSLTRFQLELGAFPTSYIPTTGSTATRQREVTTLPTSGWFSTVASGTLVVEALCPPGPVSANIASLVKLGDGTNNNNVQLQRQALSNNVAAFATVGGVTSLSVTAGTLAPGSVAKAGLAWGGSGALTAVNGVAGPASATAVSLAGIATTLFIGNNNGAGLQTNGYIRRIRYWPRTMGQNELQATTL